MAAMSAYGRGFLVTLLGVLVLTPDTLLVRLAGSDPWTVTAARGLLSGAALLAVHVVLRRRRALAEFRALGASGALVALLNAISAVAFVVSLHHTSVANTLIIVATAPLIAALLSVVVLGERIATATWVAIVAGLAGVGVVVHDGLGRGTVFGDLCALAVALSLAAIFVLVRRRRDLNLVPAAGAGALLSGLVAAPFAHPLSLAPEQIAWLLAMGLVVLPVALAAITLGPRTVPAPEVALLMLLETVLGPLWVWLGVGEAPSRAALLGGLIVIGTLAAHAAWRLRYPEPAGA